MQIADLELTELAARIAAGDVSARDATAACLETLETTGRQLNSTVATYPDEAIAAAEKADRDRSRGLIHGPLHGVPMAHKDLFDVAGRIVAAGSKIRRDHRAAGTASAIRKLGDAGAINLGALHMSEFAMSPTGFNAHLGRCLNPWNREYITGGSSSGSGAAVGARLVPASLGSDTGGSARVPAGACGITALKPTYGLVGKDGVVRICCATNTASSRSPGRPPARSRNSCASWTTWTPMPRSTRSGTTMRPSTCRNPSTRM